jgi:hypothetical protein
MNPPLEPLSGKRYVAIDPGKHEFGVATWELGSTYFSAELCKVKNCSAPWWGSPSTTVVAEIPEQRGRDSKVRVKDLIQLAAVAGRIGGPYAEHVLVREWKGSEPKESMHRRLLTVLTEVEQKVLSDLDVCDSKRHNVLDAVCLLMWRTGRLSTKGTLRYAPA